MTKSMKAVRDRKTDNRRISQNMEKAFKKMAQVFGYPNREYKDRVFRMLLKEPKVALEVYNAMNGTIRIPDRADNNNVGKCSLFRYEE